MDATDISGVQKDKKPPKPMSLVLGALTFAFLATFIVTSFKKYGGFNYSGHTTSLSDVIFEAVGAVFVFPLIHLAIASLWKAKRNSRSRRNIFFGWGLAVGIMQLLNVVQMYNFKGMSDAHVTSADRTEVHAPQDEIGQMASVRKSVEQHEAQPAYSHVTTVADPNQSMEGTYCDRLAAVGKSMVNGRNKGTQRTTVETAITATAEITESERAMYRQMTQTVYEDPSLTEAAMYERIHKACEGNVPELTEAAEVVSESTGYDHAPTAVVAPAPHAPVPAQAPDERAEVCRAVNELAIRITKDRDAGVPLDTWHQRIDNTPMTTDVRRMFLGTANTVYKYTTLTSTQLGDTLEEVCLQAKEDGGN